MSKLDKLRYQPERFFSDARSAWVRRLGQRLVPHVTESSTVTKLLEDPFEWLESTPVFGPRYSTWSARHDDALGCCSVVVPAHDAGDTLDVSLRSLLAQTHRNLEIIVVDDGSSDGTRRVALDLARRDPRIRVIASDVAHGAATARNVGLAMATGDFLTFQDADDHSHPRRIALQLRALEAPDVVASTCLHRRVLPNGEPITINGRRVRPTRVGLLFPRAVFERVGFLRPLRTGEDSELYQRLSLLGRITTVRRVLYLARFSPDSLLFSNSTLTRAGVRRFEYIVSEEQLVAMRDAMASNEVAFADGVSLYVPFAIPHLYSELFP
ncbi:MAG: glycosyltransferase family 2 protein [Sandaracinus sp.]|nr:glycosyltransferase family 2 protein [Sandaracinus sp.]